MAQGDRPGKKPFDPAKAEQMKSDFVRGAKFAPMDLLGAPVDLTTMAMRGVGIPVPEKPFLGSEYLIDKYADLGEALDINYDRPTGSGMETLGRVMAGTAGLGGEAAVALAPGIGKLFAKVTKTRGSGIEVKGSGNIEMDSSPSDLGPSVLDEIMEYVRKIETPDAIRDLVSTGADEVATDFLRYSREGIFGEPLDIISADTLGSIQSKLKADSDVLVADHLGIKVEDLTPDTPVTVYRVGDVKEGEVQSFSLDPNIGQRRLPGQRLRERRGQVKQPTIKYTVRAGDILAAPESTVPALSRLNEKEVLIDPVNVSSSDGTAFFREESLAEKISEAKNPKSRETITYMSPDEFLALAEKGESPEKLAGVRELMDNDTKFSSLPSLRFSHDGKGMAKVEGHEGRHRMMVLRDAGVERVPVRFESSEIGEGRGIRWGSQDPDSFDFVPPQERPTRITSQDGDAVLPMFDSDIYPVLNEAPTTVAPKKEVLEGEVVGTKSKKYMKLEKELGEARTPELRAARELNMETQGVEDAFDLNAASNIDKNFEFASGGDEVRATSDEFISGVIDEYQGARDQGFNRGDALVNAVRVKVRDYNEIYPDALNENSVLDDIAKNVNDDFGFDAALSRFREAQTNRNALEAELQTAKFKNVREAQEAATRVREEQLGIAGLSDSEKAAFYRNMGEQEQRGIAGIGVPEPETPKPNLRLIESDYNQEVQDALSDYATGKNTARQTQSTLKKLGYKADLREGRSTGDIQVFKRGVEDDPGLFYQFRDGGPVDMRSGIGDLFRVYS